MFYGVFSFFRNYGEPIHWYLREDQHLVWVDRLFLGFPGAFELYAVNPQHTFLLKMDKICHSRFQGTEIEVNGADDYGNVDDSQFTYQG